MPDFSTFFNYIDDGKKLDDKKLLLALRYLLASEYEAIQLYEQIYEAATNDLAIRVLKDITNEEKAHIGEIKKLIETLYPEEIKYYELGEKEVEEMIENDE